MQKSSISAFLRLYFTLVVSTYHSVILYIIVSVMYVCYKSLCKQVNTYANKSVYTPRLQLDKTEHW